MTSGNLFDDEPLDVDCPECGATVQTTIGAARASTTLHCPSGHEITTNASDLDRELEKTERGLGDLDRAIDDINRQFR